jgi:hypothetical protein
MSARAQVSTARRCCRRGSPTSTASWAAACRSAHCFSCLRTPTRHNTCHSSSTFCQRASRAAMRPAGSRRGPCLVDPLRSCRPSPPTSAAAPAPAVGPLLAATPLLQAREARHRMGTTACALHGGTGSTSSSTSSIQQQQQQWAQWLCPGGPPLVQQAAHQHSSEPGIPAIMSPAAAAAQEEGEAAAAVAWRLARGFAPRPRRRRSQPAWRASGATASMPPRASEMLQ